MYAMPAISAENVPYLAQGAVTRPNSPFAAIVGDNPTEPEIIAPYSTVKQAAAAAIRETGGAGATTGRPLVVNLYMERQRMGHVLVPIIDEQRARRGLSLMPTMGGGG